MTANEEKLMQFYTAFGNADAKKMSEYYALVFVFEIPLLDYTSKRCLKCGKCCLLMVSSKLK
jgi:hypothetical protein